MGIMALKISEFKKGIILLLSYYIVVLMLIYPNYFSNSGYAIHREIMLSGSFANSIKRVIRDYKRYSFWIDRAFGYPTPPFTVSVALPTLMLSLLDLLLNDIALSTKILVFTFYVLSGVNMYIYLFHIIKKRNGLSSFVGSVIYISMPYAIAEYYIQGHIGLQSAYMLMPILFYAITQCMKRESLKYCYLGALIFSLITFSQPQATIYIGIFVLLYFTIHIIYTKKFTELLYVVHFILVFLTLTSVWWVPIMLLGEAENHSSKGYDPRSLYFWSYAPLQALLTFPTASGAETLLNNWITIILLAILNLIAISIFFLKMKILRKIINNSETIIFISLSYILAIFLAMGTRVSYNFPILLIHDVFRFFRTPGRFTMIYCFSYSVILATITSYTVYFTKSYTSRTIQKILLTLMFTILLFNLLIFHFEIYKFFDTVELPHSENDLLQYMRKVAKSSNADEGYLLIFPSPWLRISQPIGYYSSIYNLMNMPTIYGGSPSLVLKIVQRNRDFIYRGLSQGVINLDSIAETFRIKYVVLTNDMIRKLDGPVSNSTILKKTYSNEGYTVLASEIIHPKIRILKIINRTLLDAEKPDLWKIAATSSRKTKGFIKTDKNALTIDYMLNDSYSFVDIAYKIPIIFKSENSILKFTYYSPSTIKGVEFVISLFEKDGSQFAGVVKVDIEAGEHSIYIFPFSLILISKDENYKLDLNKPLYLWISIRGWNTKLRFEIMYYDFEILEYEDLSVFYREISPDYYVLDSNYSFYEGEEIIIVLMTSYHPLWRLSIDYDSENKIEIMEHINAFLIFNGWYIKFSKQTSGHFVITFDVSKNIYIIFTVLSLLVFFQLLLIALSRAIRNYRSIRRR